MNPQDIGCTTKRYHPTRSQAKKALKVLQRQGSRTAVIYECRFCDGFHIGHPPGEQTYKRSGRPFG